MFKKEKEIINKITRELSAEEEIVRVIAFGSRIRGDNRGDSDLDILVMVREKNYSIKDRIHEKVFEYELTHGISLGLIILSLKEWEINERIGSPFTKNIMKEGMIIYDSEQRRKESTFTVSS